MSGPQIEIQAIAVVAAAACALPGVFLLLRRMAMMSDAIGHSILLGIVLAFFVTRSVNSPLLVAGAALMGVVTVIAVEVLASTRLVAKDAAIGLVFPVLFSIGVILIVRYAGNVHLDVDAVLLGELAFAPFERVSLFGVDVGPKSLLVMGAIGIANVALVTLFFKELKVATFDPALASALGLSPVVVHYGLMGMVSVTAVGAFDAVGSILVVALMVVPPAAAYLLTDDLKRMLWLSAILAASCAIAGFWLAHWLDASIAGSMASTMGLAFCASLLAAPRRGLLSAARRRARQRRDFVHAMLAIHLLNHEGSPEQERESRIEHLHDGLGWDPEFTSGVVQGATRRGLVLVRDGTLSLTERGRDLAHDVIAD